MSFMEFSILGDTGVKIRMQCAKLRDFAIVGEESVFFAGALV